MSKREKLQPLHAYRMLPRTNCKLCGCESCFAVLAGAKIPFWRSGAGALIVRGNQSW